MSWKSKISGAFAGTSAPFALHPADESRANALVRDDKEQGVSYQEYETEIRRYLATAQGFPRSIDDQMEFVKKHTSKYSYL